MLTEVNRNAGNPLLGAILAGAREIVSIPRYEAACFARSSEFATLTFLQY